MFSGMVLSGTRMIAQSRPSVGSIRVVSGTIVDEDNKAMANIVIYIKGTDKMCIRDSRYIVPARQVVHRYGKDTRAETSSDTAFANTFLYYLEEGTQEAVLRGYLLIERILIGG